MKEEIGETAGKVWEVLQQKGTQDLTQLTKLVAAKNALVHQALGWLAREDKIEISTSGKKTVVSLMK